MHNLKLRKARLIMISLLIITLLIYLSACSKDVAVTPFQQPEFSKAAGDDQPESENQTTNVPELDTTESAAEEKINDEVANEYILPDSDTRFYTREELSRLSATELRLARNEIFARYGRIFTADDLRIYFASQSWYNPDDFDQKGDSIFNEFELANVNLIVSMEADADLVDSSSVYAPLNVSYVSIVNENRQKRRLKVSTENMLDDAQSYSQIIDHGSYYEVTHGCIIAETSYDLSVMNGKRVGDLLQLESTVYRITEIETRALEDWEGVFLEYVSGPYGGHHRLSRKYSEKYYTPLFEDGVYVTNLLYTGSLYFSKDCIITVNDPRNEYRSHKIVIDDFFTQSSEVVGAEFGFHPDLHSGCLSLWGGFEIDPLGLVISYTESYLP